MSRRMFRSVSREDAVRLFALVAIAALTLIVYAMHDTPSGPRTDYRVFHQAARDIVSGHASDLYSPGRAFYYPPFVAILATPLAIVSEHGAYALLLAFELALLGASVWLWSHLLDAERGRIVTVWLVALLAPQVWLSIELGQPAALYLALVALASWAFAQRRHALAGLALAGLAVKPPLAVIAIACFVALRAWRTVIWSVVFSGVLSAVSFAMGPRAWRGWIAADAYLARMMSQPEWSHGWQQWSLLGAIRSTGVPPRIAIGLYAVGAGAVFALAARRLGLLRGRFADGEPSRDDTAELASIVALVICACSPYLFYYDATLLLGPGVVVAASSRLSRRRRIAMGGCAAAIVLLGYAAKWLRPVAPVGFVIAAWAVLFSSHFGPDRGGSIANDPAP